MASKNFYSHPTAIIEDGAKIGEGSKIWHFCHVRAGSIMGKDVSMGRDSYLDTKVKVGDHSRIQNGVSLFNGIEVDNFVFIGPHVVFTNDLYPRAGVKKWEISNTFLETGVAIGAGAIIRCGITLGAFTMIGAGAIVTKSTPTFSLVTGVPGRVIKRICACGRTRFELTDENWSPVQTCCEEFLSDELIEEAKKYAKT